MTTQTEDEAVAEDEVVLVDKEPQFRLGELFRSRKESGVAGLPALSVTMNDGLVHRDTLDRKTDGKLAPDEHLLIRKGDLAYNMMRMWQGASGSAKQDGIVSPAYVVVTPSDAIDPTFASYWFKSTRMIHLFWAYSYGITGDRLRLYYRDFAKISVTVPSIDLCIYNGIASHSCFAPDSIPLSIQSSIRMTRYGSAKCSQRPTEQLRELKTL